MKKLLATLALSAMMVLPSSALSVTIDGSPLQSDVPPQIVSGRTMLPARAIAENLHSIVNWDSKTKTATITKQDTKIEVQIDNKVARVNGQDVELDVPAMIIDGRTMLPMSFVAKNMGLQVDWDNATKTASISSAVSKTEEKTEVKEEVAKDTYKVVKVVDGDTFVVDMGGKEEKVRLLLVDTPESKHPKQYKNVPMGKVATEFTQNMLNGKSVKLEYDKEQRDRYGRLLAYVYVDGKSLNEELLRNGMAKVVKYEPNVAKYEEYKAIEKVARESKLGIWEDIAANYPQTKAPAQPNNSNIISNTGGNTQIKVTETPAGKGTIRGNKNSMIYHVPGGASYDKVSVQNIVYFETEEEAIKAGYRRAKR